MSSQQNQRQAAAQPEYIRAPEVARRLGISSATVRRLLKRKILPGLKLGKTWVVHRAQLERYLSRLIASVEVDPGAAAPEEPDRSDRAGRAS